MAKETIGFTLGCFDILHRGHINLLKNAKGMCDKLIVGVLVDEYLEENKEYRCFSLQDRIDVLSSLKYCDEVVAEETLEKVILWEKYKFDYLFVGSDWQNDKRYARWEKELNEIKGADVKVIYLPYTEGISTSMIVAQMIEKHK